MELEGKQHLQEGRGWSFKVQAYEVSSNFGGWKLRGQGHVPVELRAPSQDLKLAIGGPIRQF